MIDTLHGERRLTNIGIANNRLHRVLARRLGEPAALVACGFDRSQIEIHDQPVALFGYQADERPQRAKKRDRVD